MLKEKNVVVEEVKFDKGNKDKIEIVPKYDVSVLQDKTTDKHEYSYKINLNELKLPINKGTTVGKIKVYEKNKTITEVDLVSNTDVEKLSYLQLYLEMLKKSILGLIN